MVPALSAAAKTPANVKPRLGFVYVPHGVILNQWTPASGGSGFELPGILKPLEPFRDYTTILSGLHSRSAEPPPGVTGADHWVAAAFLCGNKPTKRGFGLAAV